MSLIRARIRSMTDHLDELEDAFRGRRFRALTDRAKRETERDMVAAFSAARSPAGRPWAERTRDYPWRPLQRTGTLRDAQRIRTTSGSDGATVSVHVRRAMTLSGTPIERIAGALWHGVKKGPRKMTGRQWAGLSSAARARIRRFWIDLVRAR